MTAGTTFGCMAAVLAVGVVIGAILSAALEPGRADMLAVALDQCEADLVRAAERLRGPNVPPARINPTSPPPVGLKER